MIQKLGALAISVMLCIIIGCSSKDCPTCDPPTAILQLDKHKIDFGDTDTIQTFSIMNKGKASLSWTISALDRNLATAKVAVPSHIGWLELSKESGTGNATITVIAHRGQLDELGASRVALFVSSSNASNTSIDSVDVHILSPHAWLADDDGSYENCATAAPEDYYWVKRFNMPAGVSALIVDSVLFNFCGSGEDIQLIGFDAGSAGQPPIVIPNNFLYRFPPTSELLPTSNGNNVYHANWFVNSSPFFIGYFQAGSNAPQLSIDTSPGDLDTTGCYVASDVNPDPDSVTLNWFINGVSQVFAVRIFVTPVLNYNPKLVATLDGSYAEENLRATYAIRGKHPRSLKPGFEIR